MHPEVEPIMVESMEAEPDSANYLTRLFGREYFERVWCIQEVTASRACIARCEEQEMDFFSLLSVAKYVEKHQGYRFPPSTLQYWNALFRRRQQSMIPSNQPTVEGSMGKLLNLLMAVRDFKSTDPRDRIFALLGISEEGLEPARALMDVPGGEESVALAIAQRAASWISNILNGLGPNIDVLTHPALIPDYGKSVNVVYRDFARFAVRKGTRVLDVLSHVQHVSDPNDNTWPSWVPKFFESRSVSFIPTNFYLATVRTGGYIAHNQDLLVLVRRS